MEWTWVVTTTLPVLTFIGGLWWSRYDGDRREHRAARAAALAAFEQLQRATHLELQDVLVEMYNAASQVAAARTALPMPSFLTGTGDNPVAIERQGLKAFDAGSHRALILQSRLADSEIRALVQIATRSARVLCRATTEAEEREAEDVAGEALSKALSRLGALVREPPSA
ncbi:MAG: hypothetical protein ACRD0W_20300 [Acidimicrobiales bacterium]